MHSCAQQLTALCRAGTSASLEMHVMLESRACTSMIGLGSPVPQVRISSAWAVWHPSRPDFLG